MPCSHVKLEPPQELPRYNLKLGPKAEGTERLRKEVGHSRLIDGRFCKQGHLLTRLLFGGYENSRSLYLPPRILKIYIEATTGFSHISCPDGLNHHITILRLCPWGSF